MDSLNSIIYNGKWCSPASKLYHYKLNINICTTTSIQQIQSSISSYFGKKKKHLCFTLSPI